MIRTQSGSGRTEVHILSGASNFQQWLLQSTTPLGQTDTVNWGFAVADWNLGGTPDLWVIRKQSGSGRTEVHILSGESNYQQWVQQITTPLGTTDSTFTFDAGDYNSDTVPDLFIIRTPSGSGWTEVHVLSGASSFQQWVLQTTTPLHPTDTVNWAFAVADWSGGGVPDFFIIKKRFATSTEVHILSG